jgi:hypothetical protein
LRRAKEIHSSTIRKAGFHERLDSDGRPIELLEEVRARRYIP